jgi:hypothetical protein
VPACLTTRTHTFHTTIRCLPAVACPPSNNHPPPPPKNLPSCCPCSSGVCGKEHNASLGARLGAVSGGHVWQQGSRAAGQQAAGSWVQPCALLRVVCAVRGCCCPCIPTDCWHGNRVLNQCPLLPAVCHVLLHMCTAGMCTTVPPTTSLCTKPSSLSKTSMWVNNTDAAPAGQPCADYFNACHAAHRQPLVRSGALGFPPVPPAAQHSRLAAWSHTPLPLHARPSFALPLPSSPSHPPFPSILLCFNQPRAPSSLPLAFCLSSHACLPLPP